MQILGSFLSSSSISQNIPLHDYLHLEVKTRKRLFSPLTLFTGFRLRRSCDAFCCWSSKHFCRDIWRSFDNSTKRHSIFKDAAGSSHSTWFTKEHYGSPLPQHHRQLINQTLPLNRKEIGIHPHSQGCETFSRLQWDKMREQTNKGPVYSAESRWINVACKRAFTKNTS